MPEELLRYRNAHERKVYPFEPTRKPGSGKVEEFHLFVRKLLDKQDERFWTFHDAVSANTADAITRFIAETSDEELKHWLRMYLKR